MLSSLNAAMALEAPTLFSLFSATLLSISHGVESHQPESDDRNFSSRWADQVILPDHCR